MIINPYIFGFDPDAQAFITAANITDNTQKTAINQLVLDLKAYNIWSKMKAIYPFVGGTASTHKFNLKDPRDLDAAFRLVFNGGWTHSSTGALPNGTNGYADTFFNANNEFNTNNSAHLSYYSRTNTPTALVVDMGCSISLSQSYAINSAYNNTAISFIYNDPGISVTNTNTQGYFLSSRINSTTHKLFKNNLQLGITNTGTVGIRPNLKLYLGCYNSNGTANLFTNRQCAFATIGDGLTDTDATNLSWITEQFQTTLGRSVNPWYNNGNLLLDNYPSAAVAYSVRKLRNYYIGAAIRVRRSSDNAEQDIYFDSTGNLDTASLLSFVGAGNGFVTTWYDQSGNGNNLTQTTATAQPRIVNAGVLETQNGKVTVRFDGSNDELRRSNVNIFNNKNYGVVFIANRIIAQQPNETLLFYCQNNLQTTRFGVYFPPNSYNYMLGGRRLDSDSFQSFNSINPVNNTTMFLNTSVIDWGNSDAYIYINNVLDNSNLSFQTNGNTSPTNTLLISISFAPIRIANANISEVIAYESLQNISAINTNINSYFNIYP